MDTPPDPGSPPSDEAGGHGAWGPSLYHLAIAVGVVAGGVAFLLWPGAAPEPAPAGAAPAAGSGTAGGGAAAPPQPLAHAATPAADPVRAVPTPPVAAAAPRAASAAQEPDNDPTPDLRAYLNPGEVPTMAEVIERLHLAGIHSGLGAFPPPGTRPPLVGLAVPEDFVLPEGYVRHHQATDDGQRIEAILMFSPDHAFVAADGTPIAVPEDRVVPPALAPPGLPIRQIVIPAPVDAGRPGR
jgi:hypothetical protein